MSTGRMLPAWVKTLTATSSPVLYNKYIITDVNWLHVTCLSENLNCCVFPSALQLKYIKTDVNWSHVICLGENHNCYFSPSALQ